MQLRHNIKVVAAPYHPVWRGWGCKLFNDVLKKILASVWKLKMANFHDMADSYTEQRGSVLDEKDYDRPRTLATESPAKQRRARASKPKIKTGCNSCK